MNKESNININMVMHLLRYFSGTLEKEEKEKVETWISFSEENKKVAKQVYYIYRATVLYRLSMKSIPIKHY